MKKQIMRICAAVFAAVIFASAFSVFGAYEELDRATFSGRGEVLAPADRATVNFCIEASAKKEAVAKKESEEILFALKERLGYISEESYYSESEPISGRYTVSRCFSFTTDDVGAIYDITRQMTEAGVTGINGIWYSLSDISAYEKEALRLAIADADNKANSVDERLVLEELSEFGCFSGCGGMCGGTDGTVSVECNISAVYRRR